MKQLGICGHFGSHENINGQMVKTRILADELGRHFGRSGIECIDSYGWKKNPLKLLFQCFALVLRNRNILIIPAAGGIKVFAPLFAVMCRIFGRKLHYSTIGGWLPSYLSDNSWLVKYVKMIDFIYVETKSIVEKLVAMGFDNVLYMPNFKTIKVIDEKEMPRHYELPYPLCTFSRVKREKGILDAIEAVKCVNLKAGKILYMLDVYGSIDDDFKNDFEKTVSVNAAFVKYKGVADYEATAEILKNYFALLFPTYYGGEGFPGTIIDAFSSGLPVIASDWLYNSEIIASGKTGIIYDICTNSRIVQLVDVLRVIYENPEMITGLKKNCLLEAKKYDSMAVMKIMTERMA